MPGALANCDKYENKALKMVDLKSSGQKCGHDILLRLRLYNIFVTNNKITGCPKHSWGNDVIELLRLFHKQLNRRLTTTKCNKVPGIKLLALNNYFIRLVSSTLTRLWTWKRRHHTDNVLRMTDDMTSLATRRVDGTPISEVTPVTIR